MDKKSGVKTYSFIVLAILFSKVLGMVRDMLLANFYGTGLEAQAFSVASQIPLTFFDVTLGTAVASAFIPVFNQYLGENKKERAYEFVNIFVSCVMVAGAVMALLLLAFPQVAISIMAHGYQGEQLALSMKLLRLMAPIVLIAVLAYSYVAVLQSLGEFKRPAIMSAISNVAMVVYFLTFNRQFGIDGLAIALTIGWVLQLLILVGPLRQRGVGFRFMPRLRDEGMAQVAALALPVLVSSWAVPINKLISSNLSSYLDAGYTTLDYAYKLYFMMAGVFSMALTNIFFPKMSRNYAAGETKENFRLLCSLLTTISMVILPILLFFTLFAQDIVRVVYERGAFTSQDTIMVGMVLSAYSVGMLGLSWQEILNKFYYSSHDSKTPMIISFVGILINVVCSLALMRKLGVTGIAVASTISVTFIALVLFVLVRRQGQGESIKPFLLDMGKVLFSTVICGGVLLAGNMLIGGFTGGIAVAVCKMAVVFFVACLAYGGALFALDAGQARDMVKLIKKKGS